MATIIDVSIKMFRLEELGDSFLLSFRQKSKENHILIDFGSFRNSAKSKLRLNKLAKEILKFCNGNIDVVVGTHQHNDHVSGFYHCSDLFKDKVEQVWLSWLDNPKIKLAENLGNEHKDLQSMTFKLNDELNKVFKGSKKSNSTIPESINDIMGFYGAKTPEIPFQSINILKELGRKKIKYLEPGQIKYIDDSLKDEVKIYVLGPPMDKAKLYDIKPNSSETYDPHLTHAVNSCHNLFGALTNYTNSESKDEENYPFNKTFKIREKESKDGLNFTKVDLLNTNEIIKQYRNNVNKWKTIDHDWLEQASRLALYLDTYTNNSSLVLAIELVKSGKVLLFAADAQTGNWLSWFDVKFENEQVSTDYLLANTVFYKVGHHGSHNATLVKGLESMTHKDLIAMIPVDKTDSNITKKINGWKMPAKNLYKRLIKQTKNRVLRMDEIYATKCDPKFEPAKSSWKKSKTSVNSTDSYVEVIIKG